MIEIFSPFDLRSLTSLLSSHTKAIRITLLLCPKLPKFTVLCQIIIIIGLLPFHLFFFFYSMFFFAFFGFFHFVKKLTHFFSHLSVIYLALFKGAYPTVIYLAPLKKPTKPYPPLFSSSSSPVKDSSILVLHRSYPPFFLLFCCCYIFQ